MGRERFVDHGDPRYVEFMASARWDELRSAAIGLQGARCRGCGRGRVRLDVHHLSYRRFGGGEEPYDLLVVCRDCHVRIHGLCRDEGLTLLQASERVVPGARAQYVSRWVPGGARPGKRGGTVVFRGVTVAVSPGEGHCIAMTAKGFQCGRKPSGGRFCAVHDPDGKFRRQKRERWLQERPLDDGSRKRSYEHLLARREARARRRAEAAGGG